MKYQKTFELWLEDHPHLKGGNSFQINEHGEYCSSWMQITYTAYQELVDKGIYCPVCGSCGEDGCCKAERCQYPDIKSETVKLHKEMYEEIHAENEKLKLELAGLKKDFKDIFT